LNRVAAHLEVIPSIVIMKTCAVVLGLLALVAICRCNAEDTPETQEKAQEESLPQLQAGWDSSEDSDDCRDRLCNGRGRCYNRGRNCRCYVGYTGAYCQTDIGACRFSPCLNNGLCTNTAKSYICKCRYGWTGKRCEIRY